MNEMFALGGPEHISLWRHRRMSLGHTDPGLLAAGHVRPRRAVNTHHRL
jgi:hypothetical protein